MRILLLAGGDSSEKEVSLRSGAAIFDSLKQLGHDVLAINPSGGKSLIGPDGQYLPLTQGSSTQSLTSTEETRAISNSLWSTNFRDVELVFIALHGGSGENGTIQGLLDLGGVKYTGSGMAASAIAMDKAITKRLFVSEGVATPSWELYRWKTNADTAKIAESISEQFDYPLIIKPNNSGSTVGLTKVKNDNDIIPAINLCIKESREILAEEFIQGRELTVAVLDGEALPVVEIVPKNELYDYEAKYTKGKSEYIAPAVVDAEIAKAIQDDAVKVYNVIGASGLARIDFMLTSSGQYYCLEVNTLPGMTNLSLAPMAAKVAGVSFDQLIEKIIESALKK